MDMECSSGCSSCGDVGSDSCSTCDQYEPTHNLSDIKRVIGVVSGKGGVGKSLVTALMAVEMQRRGNRVAVLDADITGPSIPRMFNLRDKAEADEEGILPVQTKTGIQVMSINLLLEKDTDPVIWRGPIIADIVKQFWKDVIWGDIDYMFVDMPPGTGDVSLTVFQSLPLDGIIIVTSPQELVSMIVSKAVNMAKLMDIPVLGVVENMSYVQCPDCGTKINIFGKSSTDAVAMEYGLDVIARLPLDPKLASAADKGLIELFNEDWVIGAADRIEVLTKK